MKNIKIVLGILFISGLLLVVLIQSQTHIERQSLSCKSEYGYISTSGCQVFEGQTIAIQITNLSLQSIYITVNDKLLDGIFIEKDPDY